MTGITPAGRFPFCGSFISALSYFHFLCSVGCRRYNERKKERRRHAPLLLPFGQGSVIGLAFSLDVLARPWISGTGGASLRERRGISGRFIPLFGMDAPPAPSHIVRWNRALFRIAVLVLVFPGERRLPVTFLYPYGFFVGLAVLRHMVTAFSAASADRGWRGRGRPPVGCRKYRCRSPPLRRTPALRESAPCIPWRTRPEKDCRKARGRLRCHTEEKIRGDGLTGQAGKIGIAQSITIPFLWKRGPCTFSKNNQWPEQDFRFIFFLCVLCIVCVPFIAFPALLKKTIRNSVNRSAKRPLFESDK